MRNRLKKLLNNHQFLLEELKKNFKLLKIENFRFSVNISSTEYLEMITNRYMSVLLDLNEDEIKEGISLTLFVRFLTFLFLILCNLKIGVE